MLSHSKVLKRFVRLKDVLYTFLLQKDKCFKFADLFCDDNWLSLLCYLTNIFFLKEVPHCPLKVNMTFKQRGERHCIFKEMCIMKRAFLKEMFGYVTWIFFPPKSCVLPIKMLLFSHFKNLGPFLAC